jgi:hypothetical protein
MRQTEREDETGDGPKGEGSTISNQHQRQVRSELFGGARKVQPSPRLAGLPTSRCPSAQHKSQNTIVTAANARNGRKLSSTVPVLPSNLPCL